VRMLDNAPPYRPKGVRMASQIKACVMLLLMVLLLKGSSTQELCNIVHVPT